MFSIRRLNYIDKLQFSGENRTISLPVAMIPMLCCHSDFKSSKSSWNGEIIKGHSLGQKELEEICV